MSYELCDKIRGLKPYEPITGTYPVRLDANESYIDLPEATKKDMLDKIASEALNRYPDPLAAGACGLFAAYHGISPDCVTAGNGSDELLSLLTQCFLMRGERMCVVDPDFSMYSFYGYIAEVSVDVFKKRQSDFFLDADGLVRFINENNDRLLIFSNPCNPTGSGNARGDVLRIVEGCPDCLVVVDEAYMDFWDQSVIDCVEKYDNLFVLRTCSKAFRMAGIRCGFAAGCRRLTNALRAVKSPYNVSSLSQAAAEAILSRPDELRRAAAELVGQREKLYAMLTGLSAGSGMFTVMPSRANFVYVLMERETAADVFAYLKERGIIIRCFGDALRVTAGSDEEQRQFIGAFTEYFERHGGNK